MGAFILVILTMIGSGKNLKSFENWLSKDSQSECPNDAKTFQFMLPIILKEASCEPFVGNKSKTQEAGALT